MGKQHRNLKDKNRVKNSCKTKNQSSNPAKVLSWEHAIEFTGRCGAQSQWKRHIYTDNQGCANIIDLFIVYVLYECAKKTGELHNSRGIVASQGSSILRGGENIEQPAITQCMNAESDVGRWLPARSLPKPLTYCTFDCFVS